jgi:hypothetical protein
MQERDFNQMTPQELNEEFVNIFEMLPKGLPGSFHNGLQTEFMRELNQRKDRESTELLRLRLRKILSKANITGMFGAFITLSYDTFSTYGIDNGSGRDFMQFVSETQQVEGGIFSKKQNAKLEERAMGIVIKQTIGLEQQIKQHNVPDLYDPIFRFDINTNVDMLKVWVSQFEEFYQQKPSLPSSQ